MSKLFKLITIITLSILGLGLLAPVQPTFAANDDSICNNTKIKEEIRAASGCQTSTTIEDPETVIGRIVSSVVGILGVVAVIIIVYGGIQYITSAGDSAKLKKAKDTILYGVIGLIICVLAFAITQFIIRAINGTPTP